MFLCLLNLSFPCFSLFLTLYSSPDSTSLIKQNSYRVINFGTIKGWMKTGSATSFFFLSSTIFQGEREEERMTSLSYIYSPKIIHHIQGVSKNIYICITNLRIQKRFGNFIQFFSHTTFRLISQTNNCKQTER